MNNKKQILKLFFLLLIVLTVIQCDDYELAPRKYSRIDIDNIVIQNEGSITFTGKVISKGELPIIEKGFVWSENDEPTVSSPKVSTKGDCSVGTFKLGINYDYSKDGKYKVKAFLRDSNYLVYSKSITFDCSHNSLPPNITSIIPDRVKWGDTIMI